MAALAVTSNEPIVINRESFPITFYHLNAKLPVSEVTRIVQAVGVQNVKAVRKADGSFKVFGLHESGQKELDDYMNKNT